MEPQKNFLVTYPNLEMGPHSGGSILRILQGSELLFHHDKIPTFLLTRAADLDI